jgi:YHS domain-containing protein
MAHVHEVPQKLIPFTLTDPVCKKDVRDAMLDRDSPNRPVGSVYRGVYYFFCGEACRAKFERNPPQFLGTT